MAPGSTVSVLNIMGLRLEDGLPYYGGTSLRLETASPTTAGRAYDSRRPPLLRRDELGLWRGLQLPAHAESRQHGRRDDLAWTWTTAFSS